MVNRSKANDERYWAKWKASGAIGNIDGRDLGLAYAYFDCENSMQEISDYLPKIREMVQTPKRLELFLAPSDTLLSLTDGGMESTMKDSKLLEMAFEAKEAGLRYVLAARNSTNVTNAKTADELADILNQAYQSPLYQEGEEFRGEIVYKEGSEYIFRG